MNRATIRLTSILILLGGLAIRANAADLDKAKLATIKPAMQGFVDRGQMAGAVTLVARHDQVASLEAVGYADVENKVPMRPDTIFRIASMTKPVTAVALMILVDEGKLAVADPVEKYIPEMGGLQVKARDGSLAKPSRPITLRDLLTHTSGMAGMSAGTPDLYAKRDRTLAEVMPLFAKDPLQFEPGARWSYSSMGIDTLGRIIEIASGKTYEAFVKERILDPLGMSDTSFYPTEEQRQRMAKTYNMTNGKLVLANRDFLGVQPGVKYPIPAGGLCSTAADMTKFYQMMLQHGAVGGKKIVSPEGVRAMTQVQTGELAAAFTPGMGFGLGWGVVRKPEGVTAMLSPGTFGHGGAFGTEGWIDPERDLIMVLMIQLGGNNGGDASPMRRDLQKIAVSSLEK